jgi:DNA-binding SARP family transcriptional activator
LGFVRGHWADAETHISSALVYFRRKKDPYHEALASLKLSSLFQYQGRAEDSAAAARRGLAVLDVDDPVLRFRLDGNLAITAMWMESLGGVEVACRRLAAQAGELGIPHFVAIGQHNLGIVQVTMGKLTEGLLNLRSAYEYWSALPGSPFADAADYVRALLIQGDVGTATAVAHDAERRTLPWPRPHAEAMLGVAACSIDIGEYDEGLRVLGRLNNDATRLGGLNEQASLLSIDALYLAQAPAGIEYALLAMEDGPHDPRLEAESAVARSLAKHRLGTCSNTCTGALNVLDDWSLRGAQLTVAREQIRLAPLLEAHQDRRSTQLAKDGLMGAIHLGIAAHLAPWIRRCARLMRQLEPDDIAKILPALIYADPAFWRSEALLALSQLNGGQQRAVLMAIAHDATPSTLELLGQLEGPDASEIVADIQARLTPRIHISMFGHLAVHVGSADGPRADLSKRRVRHLLGVLAAHEGRTVRREVIMDWLWPESDPASATNSLNQTVFQLRKVLHRAAEVAWSPPYLIAENEGLGLNPSLVQTDLEEFRDLARRYLGANRRESLDAPRRMVAIVQDSYLAELQYEDWASSVQGAVHAEIREGLLKIAEPASSAPPDLAFKAAAAALRLDEFDEQASAAAALQLSAGGRTKAAVAMLQALQDRYQREFGDDLPDDLLSLLNTLRRAPKVMSTKS